MSQAVLDVTSTTGDGDVQLILKSDKVDYILCILRKSETVQVPLDLIFSEGDDISFRSVGKCFVADADVEQNLKLFQFSFHRRNRSLDGIFGRRSGLPGHERR